MSHGYAWECQTQEGGWGLHSIFQEHAWKLRGEQASPHRPSVHSSAQRGAGAGAGAYGDAASCRPSRRPAIWPCARALRRAAAGVVNGIDYAEWHPSVDPHLQSGECRVPCSPAALQPCWCPAALQAALALPVCAPPQGCLPGSPGQVRAGG